MYPASSEGLNKETESEVRFFTPAFDALNTFSAHQIAIWGRVFPTAEHAYQWKKMSEYHPEVAEQVLNAGSPEAVWRMTREYNKNVPQEWHEKKVAVMEEVLRAKLAQHEDVREALQRSGTRIIIENSPVDSFWGAGPEGTGGNMMGKIWMKIREGC
jgi:ribA/ribD-fused uncharacterized protein